MNVSLKPWARRPFELICHAEHHYQKGGDYDRGLALISFDNSIEVSISTYLSLNPIQRDNHQYPKKNVEEWLHDYHSKLDFFLSEIIKKQQLPEYFSKDVIVWYHNMRNNYYHGRMDGVPDQKTLEELRTVSFWVFSTLFKVHEIESLLKTVISGCENEITIVTYTPPFEEVTSKEYTDKLSYSKPLVTAAIIGMWDDNNDSDEKVLIKLVDNYQGWRSNIQDVVQDEDSPLILQAGHWKVRDRLSLWKSMSSRIFDKHLEVLENCIIEVLSENDPQFDLPTEERYAASLHGKELKFSTDLREGLSETLALMGVYGDLLERENCSEHKPQTTAVLIIQELFKDAEWRRWASLDRLLPTIAEAEPDEFLKSVESAFQQTPCPFEELFNQEDGGVFGRTYMSGLLWALEGLAWDSKYLTNVCLLLGKLATIDPGGTWANRPVNSLTNILLPWFPQTKAPIQKRFAAIKAIKNDFPDIAWKVIISLLPNEHHFTSGTYKPRWRNIIPEDFEPRPSNEEYRKQINEYGILAVEMAKKDLNRLLDLIQRMNNLPEKPFMQLLDHISSSDIIDLPEEERYPIWSAFDSILRKHHKYSDKEGGSNKKILKRIEALEGKIKPADPRKYHRKLFSDRDFDLYDLNMDRKEQRKKLYEKREEVIRNIFNEYKIEGVFDLVTNAEDAFKVGFALGAIESNSVESDLFPDYLTKTENEWKRFIAGFIFSRQQLRGWDWVDGLDRNSWTQEHSARLLMELPFEQETWDHVKEWLQDSERLYWQSVCVNPYQSKSDLTPAIDKLLENDRPHTAIDCLNCQLHNKRPLNVEQAVQALTAAIKSEESARHRDQYETVELIKALQNHPETDKKDLIGIEWAYVSLLDRDNKNSPKTLEQELASDPEFFCDMIKRIYRSEHDDKGKEATKDQKNIATNAWRLLDTWESPPGLLDNGTFSSEAFTAWLERVKAITTESGHLDVAMVHAGKILFYSPEDPDGLWIHNDVAKALNSSDADKMREGFRTEVMNSRGVHFVDPSGKPEKELAQEWREKAEAVDNRGYPRLAAALRDIAKSYEYEADRIISEHGKRLQAEKNEDQTPSDQENTE